MVSTTLQVIDDAHKTAIDPHQTLISASEADRVVQGLKPFPVEQIGSEAWHVQREAVMSLNLQAHHNAASHSDEFVKEALVLHDKMRVLVFDLLLLEVWKQRVLPLVWDHLAAEVDSIDAYQLLYHEATLTNLLEVTLFHRDACEALGDDAALELVDWAARKLLWLNGPDGQAFPEMKAPDAKELLEQEAGQQLKCQAAEIDFRVAIAAITILRRKLHLASHRCIRYLTDRMKELPLGVAARMVSPADTPALLVALLDNPPWERRVKGTGLQRFEGGQWRSFDRLRLCQPEVQAWLALCNLLMEPATRGRYDFDGPRKGSLLRLRRHLHEAAMNQLPVLRDVARLLDALEAGVDMHDAISDKAQLIMEQVPVMREAIVVSAPSWEALAQRQKDTVFAAEATEQRQDRIRRRNEKMRSAIEFMCSLADEPGETADSTEQEPTQLDQTVRLTIECEAAAGVYGSWEALELRLNPDREPDPVSVPAAEEGAAAVHGSRHHLQVVEAGNSRALPARGRMTVAHGRRSAVAQFVLPTSETRDTSSLAPVIWLTAGRLRVEGLALQLRLQRAARGCERHKATGTWAAYQITGGACSLAQDEAAGAASAVEQSHSRDGGKDALNF